jgi:CheY-like chemotaxis protein
MEYAKTALALFSKDLKILKAKNGKEAYQQYLEHNPDLILMDIVMPDKNGYQVTRMIRQHDTKIPIIAMTAKALKEDKDTCLAAGMNDYLTKPVALIQLLKTLKKYL